MDKSSADFADDFGKYMQRAVLSSMMENTYKKRLEAWYVSFGENALSGGKLDENEQSKLKEEYDKIVSDAVKERDNLKKQWVGREAKNHSKVLVEVCNPCHKIQVMS